jgi:hypothetical protein
MSSSELTSALFAMRSKLRNEHEKIMHELQNDAAEKIDRELKIRLDEIRRQMDEKKKKAVADVIHSFCYCVMKNSSSEAYAGVGSALLGIKNELESIVPPFDTVQEDLLNKASTAFLNICRDYFSSKEDEILVRADEPLMHVEIKTEQEGEEYWAANMARANAEWCEGGSYRRAAEESQIQLLEGEENTVLKYINDQVRPSLSGLDWIGLDQQ